jgi:hypothetical protein
VAQGEGPEFNPQDQKKKQTKNLFHYKDFFFFLSYIAWKPSWAGQIGEASSLTRSRGMELLSYYFS